MKTTPLFQGAEDALLYTTQTRFHVEGDVRPHRVRLPDEDLAREVMRIENTMRKLTSTQGQLFHWPLKVKREALPRHGVARLAQEFLAIVRPGLWSIRQAFPHHQFHPLVSLFEKHMEARSFTPHFQPVCQDDVDRLNACVKAMRDEARSTAFRVRRDKHHKLVRSNTKGLLELIDRLFLLHSQLLVIRMDISYCRHSLEPWRALSVTKAEAVNHRDQMIRYLKRKCPFRPVGYAWKLEFTQGTGWHTHLLLFFDANQHQQDLPIAMHIGRHWNEVITRGLGRHHISNFEAHQYRGVGKIHYTDVAKLWALRAVVAPYLTKVDYYVRMVLSKGRTFGRSELPVMPATKRGRPRALPSARVADYVPPIPTSNTKAKERPPMKRGRLVDTKASAVPLRPSIRRNSTEASFRPVRSYPRDLGNGQWMSAGKSWKL